MSGNNGTGQVTQTIELGYDDLSVVMMINGTMEGNKPFQAVIRLSDSQALKHIEDVKMALTMKSTSKEKV